jgi:hypothetical protein
MADSNDAISLNDFTEPEDSESYPDLVELAQKFDAGELVGDQQNAQPGSGVNGFFQFLAVIVGLAILAVIFRQPTDSVRMRQDLHQLTMKLEKANIRLDQKEYLLDEIDAIRRRIQAGASINAATWREVSEAIDVLLKDEITNDKLRLIERELDRISREINETEK